MNGYKIGDRVTFTHTDGGKLPATVIGTNEDGSKLHLKVDGWASTEWRSATAVTPFKD